jgi:malate permease and related proteins
MEQTTQIINRVLPIVLLILLGSWLRRRKFLSAGTIDDLRKLVVNLALPSVLFVTFLQIELKPSYLVVFGMIFALCVALLGLGFVLKGRFAAQREYFPFLMTGFEYGMLGVSLFGGAYGLEKLGTIAVLALGHEIFIWFVFLAFLLTKRDGIQDSRQLFGAFFKSPVILAILAGIFFNLLGIQELLRQAPVSGALMTVLQFLGSLVVPLILLIVGYSIQFDRQGVRAALPTVLLRLSVLLPLALGMNYFVIRGWLGLEPIFEAALFTLLVLPPPFIIPLYMRPELVEEKHYVNNVLALYTLFSIGIYIVYFILYQGL